MAQSMTIGNKNAQKYTNLVAKNLMIQHCNGIELDTPNIECIVITDSTNISIRNSSCCITLKMHNTSNVSLSGNQYYANPPDLDGEYRVENASPCIYMKQCNNVTITDEVIGNNRLGTIPFTDKVKKGVAAHFVDCNHLTFTGNTVYQDSPVGISLGGGINSIVTDTKVIYNDKVCPGIPRFEVDETCKDIMIDGKTVPLPYSAEMPIIS